MGPMAVVLPLYAPIFKCVATSSIVQAPRPVVISSEKSSANHPSMTAALEILALFDPAQQIPWRMTVAAMAQSLDQMSTLLIPAANVPQP